MGTTRAPYGLRTTSVRDFRSLWFVKQHNRPSHGSRTGPTRKSSGPSWDPHDVEHMSRYGYERCPTTWYPHRVLRFQSGIDALIPGSSPYDFLAGGLIKPPARKSYGLLPGGLLVTLREGNGDSVVMLLGNRVFQDNVPIKYLRVVSQLLIKS